MFKYFYLLLILYPLFVFSKPDLHPHTDDSVLVITGDKNYAPYSYLNIKNEPKGLLVDIWTEWSKVTGKKIRFDFNNNRLESIESIQNGNADIHSGVYSEIPNTHQVQPIHSTKASLFSLKKNKQPTFNKALTDEKVGIIWPSYGKRLKKSYPNIEIVKYDNYDELFSDIDSGKLDLFFDSTEPFLQSTTTTELDAIVSFLSVASNLVHALQQERGTASGFISSKGMKFKQQLLESASKSDLEITTLKKLFIDNAILLKKYFSPLDRAAFRNILEAFFLFRKDVQQLNTSFPKVYSKYTQLIAFILNEISNVSDKVKFSGVGDNLSNEIYAYSTLLLYKESIGQKRAALSSLFSQQIFSKDIYEYFLTADTQEKIYLKSFFHNSSEQTKQLFYKTLNQDIFDSVHEFEMLARNKLKGDRVQVNPENWFSTVTLKIDQIQELANTNYKNNILSQLDELNIKLKKQLVSINAYRINPLDQEFFFTMAPIVYDPMLVDSVNEGLKKISAEKLKEIEVKWIDEVNGYYNKSLFTTEEKLWIKNHPIINVGGDEGWPPFDFVDINGNYNGLINDYFKVIAEISSLKFQVKTGDTWIELLEGLKNKKYDLLPAMSKTKERQSFIVFTRPYMKLQDFIYTRTDYKNLSSLSDLKGKKVAVTKGDQLANWLKENYPEIIILPVKNLLEALNSVVAKKADAYIADSPSTSFAIRKNFIDNIKINTLLTDRDPFHVRMGIRKDYPLLVSIINKSLQSIPMQKKKKINDKWFNVINFTKKSKVLNIAFNFDMPPFMFAESSSKGIESDLVSEILYSQGYDVNISQMSKSYLVKLLHSDNNFDAVSSISRVDDDFYYSDPFVSYENYAITFKQDNIKINSIDDLQKIKFTSWKGAYNDLGDKFYKLFNPINGTAKSSYSNSDSLKIDIKKFFDKKVDAIVIDKNIFQWYKLALENQDKYTFHKIFTKETSYPVVFKSKKIRDDFNQGLANFKKNGRYNEIINFYATQDIRPLINYAYIIANISARFIFLEQPNQLQKILEEFFIHPDIVHIDITNTATNSIFLSLHKQQGIIVNSDNNHKYRGLPKIEKIMYFYESSDPLPLCNVKIYYKKSFVTKKAKLIPELGTFVGLKNENRKHLENLYLKSGLYSKSIELTQSEKDWIKAHPSLKFTGDPDWLPFEAFNQKGEYIGIIAEYLSRIEKLIGIKFERVKTNSWGESIQLSKNYQVDVLSESTDSDRDYLIFTNHYINNNIVIVMDKDHNYVEGLNAIKNKKIALIKDYGYTHQILQKYPNIPFILVDNVKEGLSDVSTGKIDALLCTFALGSYTTTKMGLSNIKIVGKTEFITALGFGVRKDYAPLVGILNKAINTLTEKDHNEIFKHWIKQDYVEKIDYSLVYQIIIIAFILLSMFLFWNRKMAKEIALRKIAEQKIEESKKELELSDYVIKNAPLEIYYINLDGNIKFTNKKVNSLLGYSQTDLLNINLTEINPNMNKRSFAHILKSLAHSKDGTISIETVHKKRNGNTYPVSVSLAKIEFDKSEYIIGYAQDITVAKNREDKIIELHKHTQDSIEYASLIQGALIPSIQGFNNYFQDHFTIWEPKDIVGGDIYLLEELSEDEVLLMVIDCTGHGVPGAFVTMLVKAVERQINANHHKNEMISPAIILGVFNRSIKNLLKQEDVDSVSNAGFDGGILYYNKKKKFIRYAGANVPLFILQNKELKIIKGNRHSVGYKKSDKNYNFTDHNIDVDDSTSLYLTTDGYLDQNGGNKGFPFGKRDFTQLIKDNKDKTFASQRTIFMDALSDYQAKEERNDDVTMIGLKI
jgi:PAS domain S-box-containing protein